MNCINRLDITWLTLARRIAENILYNAHTKITNRIFSTISSKKRHTTNKSVLRFKYLTRAKLITADRSQFLFPPFAKFWYILYQSVREIRSKKTRQIRTNLTFSHNIVTVPSKTVS